MTRHALFLGSIGAVMETSDIQRRAYNRAMAEMGLDWTWSRETYRALLAQSGGRDRLALLSAATGAALSDDTIAAIHARKTVFACAEIRETKPPLRPGVAALVDAALSAGVAVAWVTSTFAQNTAAVIDAAKGGLPAERFATIIHRDDVARGKPDPEAYRLALARCGVAAPAATALEDTAASLRAAKAAGVWTAVTPGLLTDDQDVFEADAVAEDLRADDGRLARAIADRLAIAAPA